MSRGCHILFRLSEQDTKLSKLAKDLNVTMQEVHRNVNRLMDVGLIKKNSEGIFSLTTFGNTIIKQIPTYDFLSRNKEYFSDHIIGRNSDEIYSTNRCIRQFRIYQGTSGCYRDGGNNLQ